MPTFSNNNNNNLPPERGSQPFLTTCDRELVSVLEVRIEPRDLNPRTLTPQSVALPILPRAGVDTNILRYINSDLIYMVLKSKIFIQRNAKEFDC